MMAVVPIHGPGKLVGNALIIHIGTTPANTKAV